MRVAGKSDTSRSVYHTLPASGKGGGGIYEPMSSDLLKEKDDDGLVIEKGCPVQRCHGHGVSDVESRVEVVLLQCVHQLYHVQVALSRREVNWRRLVVLGPQQAVSNNRYALHVCTESLIKAH